MRAGIKNKFINSDNCLRVIKNIERNGGNVKQNILDYFVKKSIMVQYGNYNVYEVYDVSFDKTPTDCYIEDYTNLDGNREQMSLLNYYAKKYAINVRPDQPLLVHRKKGGNEIYLIPELCHMTGMDEETRNNERLRQEMLKKARINANERIDATKMIKKMFYSTDKSKINKKSSVEICNEWGLEIRDIAEFNGNVLKPPVITYADNRVSRVERGKFRHQEVYKMPCEEFTDENFTVFCNRNDRNSAYQFMDKLEQSSKQIGIRNRNLRKTNVVFIERDDIDSWQNSLKDEIYNQRNRNNRMMIFIIVVNNNNQRHYKKLKKLLNERGIINQFVKTQSISKPLTVSSNIFLQIFAKAGGRVYKIDFHEKLVESRSAVVGIETNSVGVSVVMSYDKNFSLYFNESRIFSNTSDLNKESYTAELIVECLGVLLNKFEKYTNGKIDKLFIYRSGTNEFGNQKIIKNEIPKIQNLLNGQIFENIRYKITLVVTKQDIKLFTKNHDNYSYPGEGIVIEKGLIKPNEYEFYLLPTHGTGTTTFFKIVAIRNLERMPRDIFHEMTNNLCYYFWNWSGAIKVPACIKMAEKQLSFLENDSNECGENLKNKPYYI